MEDGHNDERYRKFTSIRVNSVGRGRVGVDDNRECYNQLQPRRNLNGQKKKPEIATTRRRIFDKEDPLRYLPEKNS